MILRYSYYVKNKKSYSFFCIKISKKIKLKEKYFLQDALRRMPVINVEGNMWCNYTYKSAINPRLM